MRSQKRRRRSALAGKNTVSLGRRIRAARQSRGMTQHELARGACSISFVSMDEHDLVRPSLATLKVLAERLGKPLSHFFDDEAAPSAQVQLHHAEALLRQHRFAEALEAFTAASAPPHTADQARWALGAGQALAGLRRFEEAGAHLEAAARRAATSGDAELMAAAANAMGFLAFRQRRFAQAHEIFSRRYNASPPRGCSRRKSMGSCSPTSVASVWNWGCRRRRWTTSGRRQRRWPPRPTHFTSACCTFTSASPGSGSTRLSAPASSCRERKSYSPSTRTSGCWEW